MADIENGEEEKVPEKAEKATLFKDFPTVKELLNSIGNQDTQIGLIMSLVLLGVLVLVPMVVSDVWIDPFDALGDLFYLVIGSVLLVVFFKEINGSIISKVIVWHFGILLVVTLSAFWVQAFVILEKPFLVKAECFIYITREGCALGPDISKNKEGVNEEKTLAAVKSSNVGNKTSDKEVTSEEICDIPIEGTQKVYVQFSGALSRDRVEMASKAIHEAMWEVQDPKRGGERTAKAAGLNEVRYFHEGDKNKAIQLAYCYTKEADWLGGDGQQNLGTGYVKGYKSVPIGQLEIWTSVN